MSSITLDGSNRIVGTEFIKLEITGSSNLATEGYVLQQIAIGGGGGTSTTDLSGYYHLTQTNTLLDSKYSITETNTLLDSKYSITQTNTLLDSKYSITETNTLLDTKLNINNPQDMNGVLRIGHITGNSQIILNAVSSTKSFYVNGDSQVLGNLTVSSLDSTGYINVNSIQTNTYNTLNTNDILFQSNNDTYLQYDVSTNGIIASKLIQCGGNLKTQEIDTIAPLDMILKVSGDSILELKTDDRIIANKLIQCGGNLKTQEIDTIAPLDLIFKRNNVSMVELQDGKVVLNINTECNNIITCDNFDSRSSSTISNYIMNNSAGQIKFYVGSPVSPDATTNLVMTLENNFITFHKPTSPEIGGGTIDDSNYVKKTGENSQLIVSETYFQATALVI